MTRKQILLLACLTVIILGLVSASAQSPQLSINVDSAAAKVGIQGATDSDYLLESASQLSLSNSWLPLAFISLTNSPQFWFDSASLTQSQGFYRASVLGGTRPAIALSSTNQTVIPGMSPNLSWLLSGDTNNLQFLIRVREPGTVFTNLGALSLHPGVRPATGRTLYLATDGSWTTNETTYINSSRSGTIVNVLPSSLEGEWQFEFLLRDAIVGDIAAFASERFLVSSIPRIDLRINRPLANTTDRVRVDLLTTAGITNRAVKITATLTQPDGAEVSLPSFVGGLNFLYEGDATNTVFTLLDDYLEAFGMGNYHVNVRMVDGNTWDVLGLADAAFQVCDTTGTVDGVVVDENASPFDGATASSAAVNAINVDEMVVIASASIGANGQYALELPSGRYLISAEVLDAAGSHSALSSNLVIIDCSGGGATVNLTANPPTAANVAGVKGGSKLVSLTAQTLKSSAIYEASIARGLLSAAATPASVNASDGLPKPRVSIPYGRSGSNPITDAAARDFLAMFTSDVRTAAGTNVTFLSRLEQERIFHKIETRMLLGVDDSMELTTTQMSQATDLEFDMKLEFFGTTNLQQLTASLIVAHGPSIGIILRRTTQTGTQITAGMVRQAASDMGIGLFALLRANQDLPLLPTFTLAVSPTEVQLGNTITATGTLKDRNGALAPNKAIRLEFQGPNFREAFNLQTDTNASFSKTYTVGAVAGSGFVKASFYQPGKSNPAKVQEFRVVGSSDLYLSSPHGGVYTGESEPVTVNLRTNHVAVGGATITLSAVGGTLSTATVTTDASGSARFTFTAGNRADLATITANYQQTINGNVVTRTYNMPLMIFARAAANLSASSPTVLDNGTDSIVADIRVGDARVPALPVQFSLQGAGTLSVVASQTDENGQAIITYLAPTNGTGSSVITSIATADNQRYTNTITVNYKPLCNPLSGSYAVTDIGVFLATCINSAGQVAGVSLQTGHAVLYSNGTITALGTLSGNVSQATAINSSGQVVGFTGTSGVDLAPEHAFLYSNGTMTDLGTLGGNYTHALGINDSGKVVGWSTVPESSTNPGYEHAFLYSSGTMTDLGTLGGSLNREARAINSSGQIVGMSNTTSRQDHAFLYSNGGMTDLGTLGGYQSAATAINDGGQVVGMAWFSGGLIHAFLYSNGTMSDLGTLGGNDSRATAINGIGQVVGSSNTTVNAARRAFLYSNGTMIDLNNFVPAGSGWVLNDATGINECGVIVANGANGHAYLLTPVGP